MGSIFTMSSKPKWQRLKLIPDKYYGIPVNIKNQLIVPLHNALLRYDAKQNKWKETYKYPSGEPRILSLVQWKNDELYGISQNNKLIRVGTKTNSGTKLYDLPDHMHIYKASLFIGDNLHLFATINIRDSNRECPQPLRHYIFNIKNNKFKQIDTNIDVSDSYLGAIYIKSKHTVLLIESATIYSYHIVSRSWNLLKPNCRFWYRLHHLDTYDMGPGFDTGCKRDYFGFVLTPNERNLILVSYEAIYNIDLNKMKIRKSEIAPPYSKPGCHYHATIGDCNEEDKILSSGYIRDCWSKDKDTMKDVRYPPMYLIRIIQSYFCDHDLHLFECSITMGHWKIKMNHILAT